LVPGDRPFDFGRYSQRYVALHLMYIGWSYQGLARQADSENTIEVRHTLLQQQQHQQQQ
jgi:tRNA U38,U39,U40 pseudouridine synthase TruA